MVALSRSPLTLERMAGPSFSRMAEMMLADLPQRLGPMTAMAERSPTRLPGRGGLAGFAQLAGHQVPARPARG